jgi:hypothetical protein
MVKSGLEFIILKSYTPLKSCCCPVQKNLPTMAELAWQVSRYLWRGKSDFKIKNSRPLFTIIFKPKIVFSWLKILVTYSSGIVCYPPGFYDVKKPKSFVIISSDKSSERNLSCFFDIIKPRRIENLQNQ